MSNVKCHVSNVKCQMLNVCINLIRALSKETTAKAWYFVIAKVCFSHWSMSRPAPGSPGCRASPYPKYLTKPHNAIFLESQVSKDIQNDILDCRMHKFKFINTQIQPMTKCQKYLTYMLYFCYIFSQVWSGLIWSGMVWYVMVWSGLVWSGLVWSGLVWSGLLSNQDLILSKIQSGTQEYIYTVDIQTFARFPHSCTAPPGLF